MKLFDEGEFLSEDIVVCFCGENIVINRECIDYMDVFLK